MPGGRCQACTSTRRSRSPSPAARSSRRPGCSLTGSPSSPARSRPPGSCRALFGHVSACGNYPISTPGGDWRSLVMETVLTFILVSIILNTATGSRSIGHNAAIAVGAAVALLGLFASPISGASMNPARSLGPDIVGVDFTGWWVYVAGPVAGAFIAVVVITTLRGLPRKAERTAAEGGELPQLQLIV